MKKIIPLLFMCLTIISYAQTTAIPDAKFEEALIALNLDDVLDGSVATANISTVKNLNLSAKEISDLTGIEDFIALENLTIPNNYNLKKLDLSKNTALKSLFSYGNFRLESFDFSKNAKLQYLNLGNCGITSIDVSIYPELTSLYLQSNKLTSIDLSKNTKLDRLSLSNNELTSIDLSKNTELYVLSLATNNLENIDLTNQTKLGTIELNNNLLKKIDLSTNLDIQSLAINNNQLTTLDVSLNTKLLRLFASNNPQLERLNIKNGANNIIENQYFDIKNTPRLTCVQVDDPTWSTTNWKNKDFTATYNENCEPITWSGNVNSDWSLAGNWAGGNQPNTTDKVLIPSTATNFPTINTNTTVKSIDLQPGATLLVNAEVNGNVIYKRNIATTNWYLMSSPATFEGVRGLIKNNQFANGTKNDNIGLGFYSNQYGVSRWEYKKRLGSIGLTTAGKGYAVKLALPSEFFSTGPINSGNIDVEITKNATPYNLIGNPYLALVKSQSFLTRNTTALESETIWVWNQATNSYDTKVTADNFNIATGQAFFVKSKATTGTVNFQLSDQTHGAETFQRKANDKSELKLLVSNGEVDRYTKIYFIASATKGFDNGYDGELFSGVENKFEVYSELLENNKNKKYQIQSIPTTEEHTIIPIGIKASTGETIKFSIENKNNLKNVYLEDKEKKLFTKLDNTTENYSVTLSKNTNGTGRFYLHTSSKETLGNNTIAATPIKINHIKPNLIKVEGINDLITIEVYTLQGKTVIAKNLKHNNTQLTLPQLASGVYIVKVKAKEAQVVKKIILK
ncbi:T9SS type A sorting domain-containing protein [Tenacibaculum sp. 190524A02b]|uniref:T9SS type A sorting domain-containing protein n=1 Tax=Tenacibaculum vairaonense TaxID=3137860 RepID=UPI0031FAB527